MDDSLLALARQLAGAEVSDEALALAAADVEEYIKGYCGVTKIPEGCRVLAAKMAAAEANGSLGEGALKSVTRGDFTASFDPGKGSGLESFDRRLNQFRRLKW